jgi:FlaA1/EpsC-like NDP-sugar epimerase
LIVFVLSTFIAFQLRFDGALPSKYVRSLGISLTCLAIAKLASFAYFQVNRSHWGSTSVYDAQKIALANTAGSALGGLVIVAVLGPWGIPRSLYVLDWMISCLLTGGMRLTIRIANSMPNRGWNEVEGTKTLIYGAGRAGRQLCRELRENRTLNSQVVGFIDDDPSKAGLILDGMHVLGAGPSLARIAKEQRIERLLIAIPSASQSELVRILNFTADAEVEYKMVPGLASLVQGMDLGRQIRDIAVEDILGRQAIELNQDHITERVQGKVVMVTGAAGSIGSELCRQIARFRPTAIIGFDVAETPLFQLDRELCATFPDLKFHPEIGSITNSLHLVSVMSRYQPSVLYHAAAYKHVSLMETHIFAAVENNILGTWETAQAAIRQGVEDFVLISTDKAVRPTSMMGASKRIAELVIRTLQSRSTTRFVAVRFGNVLGSNGSVVPIFKEQIAAGGPVTITHPEMRRYFMTIPEAAQLVLQAFSFGNGGDVFLLDMGEPVKITDLARDLILLSGYKPEKDIKIEFTGLRPGEKLFEELNLHDESLLPTTHDKIRRYASPSHLEITDLQKYLRQMRLITERRDLDHLLLLVKDLVSDYTPSRQLLEATSYACENGDRQSRVELQDTVNLLSGESLWLQHSISPTSENN